MRTLTQNGHHSAGNIFRLILLYEYCCIFIQISLKFVPKGLVYNKSALVQIMTWHYSEYVPMITQFTDALIHYFTVMRDLVSHIE